MLLFTVATLASPGHATDVRLERLDTDIGPLHYLLLVPDGKGPHIPVLALPPGDQSLDMVRAGLDPWADQMLEDGFLVVSPIAPTSAPFTDPASFGRLVAVMDHVESAFRLRGDWRLFGISNGGLSAFALSTSHPDRFRNVTVLPGAFTTEATPAALRRKRVTLVVGSRDDPWLGATRQSHAWLEGAGVRSELVVLEGQRHDAYRSVHWSELKRWLLR